MPRPWSDGSFHKGLHNKPFYADRSPRHVKWWNHNMARPYEKWYVKDGHFLDNAMRYVNNQIRQMRRHWYALKQLYTRAGKDPTKGLKKFVINYNKVAAFTRRRRLISPMPNLYFSYWESKFYRTANNKLMDPFST